MSTDSPPEVSPDTLTAVQEEIVSLLIDPELDMSEEYDPDDMEDLFERMRSYPGTDREGGRFCEEALKAALRLASFDTLLAADYLERAAHPERYEPVLVSTPGQERYVTHFRPDDRCPDPSDEPGVLPIQVHALRELKLKDERGRVFCDEVLTAALRSSFYDDVPCRPLTVKQARITNLKCIFCRLAWSTVARVYERVKGRWEDAIMALGAIDTGDRV
jgi:hypothetical protein